MSFKVEPYSDRAFILGEAPHWNHQDKKLYFVDIPGGLVASYDSNKKFQQLFHDQTNPCSVVLPVEGESDKFVFSLGTELYVMKNNEKKLLAKLDKKDVRFNDGKCDAKGRIWVGTMPSMGSPRPNEQEKGALYKLNGDKFEVKQDKVHLSNGLCWSLKNDKMYYIDSIKRTIYVYKYDIESGNISDRKELLNMKNDKNYSDEWIPDGMTIDANGNLWIALFRGSRIINISGEDGKYIQSIQIPTYLVTSVCFGGENLNEMYVTTSHKYIDEERKKKEPLAGYIFKVTSDDKNFRGFKPHFNAVL